MDRLGPFFDCSGIEISLLKHLFDKKEAIIPGNSLMELKQSHPGKTDLNPVNFFSLHSIAILQKKTGYGKSSFFSHIGDPTCKLPDTGLARLARPEQGCGLEGLRNCGGI